MPWMLKILIEPKRQINKAQKDFTRRKSDNFFDFFIHKKSISSKFILIIKYIYTEYQDQTLQLISLQRKKL